MQNDFGILMQLDSAAALRENIDSPISFDAAAQKIIVNKFGDAYGQ